MWPKKLSRMCMETAGSNLQDLLQAWELSVFIIWFLPVVSWKLPTNIWIITLASLKYKSLHNDRENIQNNSRTAFTRLENITMDG
jgi:hypothetical protein